jgi:hypothetical protein
MTGDLALTLPVVQMGHVEKLVEISQNQPHVQQLATQQNIVQELKKQESRVAETQRAKKRKIRDREEEESGGAAPRKHFSPKPREEKEARAEQESGHAAPWVGNLVDVKV